MLQSHFSRSALALTCILALSACGSDSDDDDEPDQAPTNTIDDPISTTGTTDTTSTEGGDNIDLTDPSPRVITSECGTLPVAEATFSASLNAPTSIMEGQLVRGTVDPFIAGGEQNYWAIDLPTGYQHIFIDSERTDIFASLGISVQEVDEAGTLLNRINTPNAQGFRTRTGALFLVDSPRTVLLKLETATNNIGSPQDYVMGVFANGRSIPSPYFEDCPTITPLAVGTTSTLRLNPSDEASDSVAYQIDLEERAYSVETQAALTDGGERSFGYEFTTTSGFGLNSSRSQIASLISPGGATVANGTSMFSRPSAGPVWLNVRMERGGFPLDVEFTINPDGN